MSVTVWVVLSLCMCPCSIPSVYQRRQHNPLAGCWGARICQGCKWHSGGGSYWKQPVSDANFYQLFSVWSLGECPCLAILLAALMQWYHIYWGQLVAIFKWCAIGKERNCILPALTLVQSQCPSMQHYSASISQWKCLSCTLLCSYRVYWLFCFHLNDVIFAIFSESEN